MQFRVYLYGIVFHQLTSRFEIAFTLDALDFAQQLTEQATELFVIVHLDIGLSVFLDEFGYLFSSTLLESPLGDELTVTHVGFFYVVAQLDTYQLSHQAVHHIRIVFGLVSIVVWSQSQFTHLGIRQIVQTEQIGTGLFDGRTIRLQGIRVYTWKQLSGTMTETFVQVGMKVASQVTILFQIGLFHFAIYKLIRKSVSMSRLVVSIGKVSDSHRLGTMHATNPVGIRQIDTDSGSRIQIAGNDSSCNHLGRHALHFFFLETLVYR